MDTSTAVEFRTIATGDIVLHLNGRPAPMMGQNDVRGVRTGKLRAAVLAALDDAVRDGARHGECDQTAEMAAALRGEPVPGHIRYGITETDGGWSITRADGDGDPEVILTGGRPSYVSGDVANALQRAFAVGGRFGHPDVDGYARPHPCPSGALMTAVRIERDVVLDHSPARSYSVAYDMYGTRIVGRITDAGGAQTFAVFHRHDGPSKTTSGHVVSAASPRARWQTIASDLPPDQYAGWDGRAVAGGLGNPGPALVAWLDRAATLRPA